MDVAASLSRNKLNGIAIMFVLQFFSSVTFSIIFSLLALYSLFNLHFETHAAYNLVAAYNALGYAPAILGGVLAERYLGYRLAVKISVFLGMAGMLILIIPHIGALYFGLACITISSGIMTPALLVLLGRLYAPGEANRASGFTIAYVGTDAGTFIAAASSGYLSSYFGYGLTFVLGACCLAVMLIVFLKHEKIYVSRAKAVLVHHPLTRLKGVCIVLLFLPIMMLLLDFAATCNFLMLVCGIISGGFIIFCALKEKGIYRGKLFLFLSLLCVSCVFDSLYFLSPSTLTVFTQLNINRHIGSFLIPAATYSALNPLFVIVLGPLMSVLWMKLSGAKKDLSLPTKFAIGIVLMGIGYLVLMIGAQYPDHLGLVSSSWIIASYFLQTLGELFISPTGYAMVGSLVPVYLEGTMMGISQFSSGVGGALSGFTSNWIIPPSGGSPFITNIWYQHAFGWVGMISVFIGTLVFLAIPYLKKLGSLSNDPATQAYVDVVPIDKVLDIH